MAITDELVPVLKKLRLSGVLQTLDLRTKEAVDGDLSHTEFLFRLCTDEVERREHKRGVVPALPRRSHGISGDGPSPSPRARRRHGRQLLPQPAQSQDGLVNDSGWTSLAELRAGFFEHLWPVFPNPQRHAFRATAPPLPGALRWTSLAELEVDMTSRSLTAKKQANGKRKKAS